MTEINNNKPTILVLDIDHTLGCFDILYTIFTYLSYQPSVTKSICKELLDSCLPILENSGVFHPELRKFLRYITRLKQLGCLDAIVLFTNQGQPSPTDPWWPITPFLTACFQTLSGSREPLFDRIYIRSHTVEKTVPPNPKDMNRILADIQLGIDDVNLIIVDDYPEGIVLNGEKVPLNIVIHKVEPYFKRFDSVEDVEPILDEVMESLPDVSSDFYISLWEMYKARRPSKGDNKKYQLSMIIFMLLDALEPKETAKEIQWTTPTEISLTYEQIWTKWCQGDV